MISFYVECFPIRKLLYRSHAHVVASASSFKPRDFKMLSASSPILYTSVFTWFASDLIDSPDACLNRSNRRIHVCHSSGFEKSIGDGGAIWYDGVAGAAIVPLLTPCTVTIQLLYYG